MKTFIWTYVGHATDFFHDDGGVLVVARDLDHARAILHDKSSIPEDCEAFTVEPDYVLDAGNEPSGLVVTFPDSGCC